MLKGRVAESGLKHSPAKGADEGPAGSNPVPSAWFNHGGVNDTQGKPGEELFQKLALARGWIVSPATSTQNLREHWDFSLTQGTTTLRVEVKGRKRLSRGDRDSSNHLVWIELKNSWGNPGWLYGSADLLSFEFDRYLVLCHRGELQRFCDDVVSVGDYVKNAKEALYRSYTRMDRKDVLSLIRVDDLFKEDILWEVWFK